MDYQLIVIGAGPGGYTAALRAAALGLRTSVVVKIRKISMVKCGKIYAIHMQDRHAALDDWQKS